MLARIVGALVLLGVSLVAARAQAEVLCVVPEADASLAGAEALGDALALEARKRQLAAPAPTAEAVAERETLEAVAVATATACPIEARYVASSGPERVVVRGRQVGPSGADEGFVVEAGDVDPLDRVDELARRLLERLVQLRVPAAPVPMFDVAGVPLAPSAPELPLPAPRRYHLIVEVGATWRNTVSQARGRGALEVLIGVSLASERWLVALEGGWEWPGSREVAGVTATMEGGEVVAVARGGGVVGPLILRAGAGLGVATRHIAAHADASARTASVSHLAGLLVGELEATWRVVGPLRLGALFQARVGFGAPRYVWLGHTLWTALDAGLSLGVRLGFAW